MSSAARTLRAIGRVSSEASPLELGIHWVLENLTHLERRFEPFFRPQLNAALREPSAWLLQALINLQRRNEGLGLAEERPLPSEKAALDSIIATMATYM